MSNISFNISTTKPKISYDIKLMKTGKSEYSGTFDLSMADGDQVITPNEGRVFSKVIVKKPDAMVAENIRKDINIGGVVGSLKPYVPVVSSELNVEPKTEIQIFTPSENEYYDKVNVDAVTSSIDSNIVPENIRNNVEILGVKGTMLPQGQDMYQQLVNLTKSPVGLDNSSVTNYDFLENLDTSQCTSFQSTFYNAISLERVPESWNTSNVKNFSQCFYNCPSLKSLPNWDFSNATSLDNCYYSCKNLSGTINLNIPNATNIQNIFRICSNINEVNLILGKSKIGNLTYAFNSCRNLEKITLSDTSAVTNIYGAFYACEKLQNISNLNLKNVTNAYQAFGYTAIENFDNLFSNKVSNFTSTFTGCKALKNCEIDMLSTTNNNYANTLFSGCASLTNLKLHNVKVNLTIGSGTSWGHLLTVDSLVNTIKELWDYSSASSTHKLSMGSANLPKIANIYVKLITPTQEQIEADPYINNKKPCELCESTDEGAMTITAYANSKHWTLA